MMIHVYLVVCLCGFLSSPAFGDHSDSTSAPPGYCLVQGELYEEGQDVPDEDPCKFCMCTRDEGVICAMSDCAWTPCLNPVIKDGDCCPTCQEGCVKDGVQYEFDQAVPDKDPCKFCTCTRDEGVICAMMDCAWTPCLNPVQKKGDCCPTCLEGCVKDGVQYEFDEDVPDKDPCTFCTCTRDEGVICAMMACAWTPCLNPVLKEGDCCPTCQEGCVKNGVHYEIGDNIPTPDPCEFCECSLGGEIACAMMSCALPLCDNLEYLPGQCCPVCPEGCFVDGVHYDYDADVPTPNPCEFCTCTPGGTMCAMVGCARPPCANPETPPGQCCPVCPNWCYANGEQYEHGDIIPTPNPCEYCECTPDAGIVCAIMDCARPPCANPEQVPGQCCPVCPEGCEVDGVHYDYGQVIPGNDRCERCVCGAFGPLCEPVTCPPVNCIDPKLKKGECCPICPKGPNCAYGRRLIPIGEVYSPKPRITCSCRTEPWEPMASCQKSMGAKYAARLLKRKSSILNPILLQFLQQNAKP